MEFTSTCCGVIPIRNGVIALAVLTMLEAIGDIVFVTVFNLIHCDQYKGGHPSDGCYYDDNNGHHSDNNGHHSDNNGHHADNYGHHSDNYGHHTDNYGYYNRYDYAGHSVAENWSLCSSSFGAVIIWIVALGSISCFYAVCLLIGVKKMIPNLLISVVFLMGINGATYLTLGILVLFEIFLLFPPVVGIWYICWSVLVFYHTYVVYFYRTNMIQQLMNRGLVIAAYPPAVVMPGMPVYHTAMPGGMYPPVMTVHPGQPGRGITTQLQPGLYAQPGTYVQSGTYAKPGTYAQPGAYANPAFYTYTETYVHPQLGAYPQPGAYPLTGNPTQPGVHQGNKTSSPNNDQPPPYTLNP